MAKISNYKAISYDDYSEEAAEIMEDLADILNPFMREVTDVINGNIDFDNLRQSIIELQVTVDGNGKPNVSSLNVGSSSIKGLDVISARNLTNNSTYPTSKPFITYTPSSSGNTITLNNISGLPSNNKFLLNILVYY
jgi:hypothetical protein